MKKSFGEKLKQARNDKKLKQSELAKQLGVTNTTVSNWENNISKPDLDMLSYICGALEVKVSYFLEAKLPEGEISISEFDIIKKYRNLDPEGQAHINTALNWETDRTDAIKKLRDKQTTVIDFDGQQNVPTRYIQYYQKVSAGTGELIYEDTPPEQIAIPDIPKFRRVAYAVKVSGHSMENTYYDGDLLLIEPACIVDIGENGIFNVGGKAFVKKRGETELISLNEGYGNIPLTNEARCMGRVVDRYVAD